MKQLEDIAAAARVLVEFWDEDDGFCCAFHACAAMGTLIDALETSDE